MNKTLTKLRVPSLFKQLSEKVVLLDRIIMQTPTSLCIFACSAAFLNSCQSNASVALNFILSQN